MLIPSVVPQFALQKPPPVCVCVGGGVSVLLLMKTLTSIIHKGLMGAMNGVPACYARDTAVAHPAVMQL